MKTTTTISGCCWLSLLAFPFHGTDCFGFRTAYSLSHYLDVASSRYYYDRSPNNRQWIQKSSPSDDDNNNNNNNEDSNGLPKLIIFDLDGCLWRPEMYELLYFSGGQGAPFTKSPDYDTDGTVLTCAGEPVRLLGQVREVMQELYPKNDKWKDTQVGISSRTDRPDWARELLETFTIREKESSSSSFALMDVFQGGPIVMESDSKVDHFKRISHKTGVPMEDILFFDNERDNCREVAKLGVVVAYCPDGVSKLLWEKSLEVFPTASGKVIGLDIYGYDTLEGVELFYDDGDDYKRTEW